MASMAEGGGPMKISPASVHFFAKPAFSLNCVLLASSVALVFNQGIVTYKSIARVYSLASLAFGNFDYSVSIQVGRGFA